MLSHGHKTSSSTVEVTSSATICFFVRRLCSSGAHPPTQTTPSCSLARLGDIALHADHLDTEVALLEAGSSRSAWQPPHSPSLRRVAHGRSCGPLRPLSQLQNTNDLTAACSNIRLKYQSWLHRESHGTRTRLKFIDFDIQSRNEYIWIPSKRMVVTPAVFPRVLEILKL